MSRKRKQESACENYLSGNARKAHRLRSDLEERLSTPQLEEHAESTSSSVHCTTCAPVLEAFRSTFLSFRRQGTELRHSGRVLPNSRKPDTQHYRNLVQQNKWIRSNLFDAVGNYKYCSTCIVSILGIGSQRLAHQRSIKQREAHIPIVGMTKSTTVNDHLEDFVVMPPEGDNFKEWWDTVEDTEQVQVRYPHEQH